MTALEDKLRAAIHATASQLPADPPPLRLSPRSSEKPSARRHWIAWTAPLASAALVVAVIAGSLVLTSGGKPPQAGPKQASISQASVPPYYVALVTGRGEPDEDDSPGTAAQVRATLTGAVLATIAVPKPYVTFSAVKGAADDRTFVLAAQGTTHPALTQQELSREYPQGYVPPTRFYVLRIDPASATPSGRVSLQALPAGLVPAKAQLDDMALSPDGTLLAADIGGFLLGPVGSHLYVFNLATGTKRSWSYRICSRCVPAGGGLGFGGVNVDALSWTADGTHLAFVGPGKSQRGSSAVRLLDVTAPGTNLVTDSKIVAGLPGANTDSLTWRGAVITPDGRTVVVIEELATNGEVREALLKISAVTGRVTQTLNNISMLDGNRVDYEQVLFTNTTGSELVVSYAKPGMSAGILRGDTYTPIPWNPRTSTAAW
jgi:hypothetical protein